MDVAFADTLLSWYGENRRVLPWREDPTPYHVFLSEIMLQQTRVDTVVSYFLRFIDRYPSFNELAKASEDDVLLLWQGLGYYSRARNLLKAAKIVVSEYGGELPQDEESLNRLPGVGDYVCRAVRAIAFNLPAAAVDGNLLRVYARIEALPLDVTSPTSKKECESYFLSKMKEPSSFNQALMDLGELVCLPNGTPRCENCPFQNRCKAKLSGNPLDYPLPKKKGDLRRIRLAVLLVQSDEEHIAVRKRPEVGLLAGLYEFPNSEGAYNVKKLKEHYPSLSKIQKKATMKHRFSHIEWTMDVFVCEGSIEGTDSVSLKDLRASHSLPTAFAKTLSCLQK